MEGYFFFVFDTKQNCTSAYRKGCNIIVHTYWGKGPCVLSARVVRALRASPSLGPTLLPGHFAEEAEVQGPGRLDQSHGRAGPLLQPFSSSFWRPLAQHAILYLKPQGNKSFLERPTTARRTLRRL